MSHPTEAILDAIKFRLSNSVDNLENVFWPNEPVEEEQLPCAVIVSAPEEIQPYNLKEYLVDLSVEIKYLFLHDSLDATKAMLDMVSACDAQIKQLTGVMTILEVITTELGQSLTLENRVLSITKNYSFKYRRLRGLG